MPAIFIIAVIVIVFLSIGGNRGRYNPAAAALAGLMRAAADLVIAVMLFILLLWACAEWGPTGQPTPVPAPPAVDTSDVPD